MRCLCNQGFGGQRRNQAKKNNPSESLGRAAVVLNKCLQIRHRAFSTLWRSAPGRFPIGRSPKEGPFSSISEICFSPQWRAHVFPKSGEHRGETTPPNKNRTGLPPRSRAHFCRKPWQGRCQKPPPPQKKAQKWAPTTARCKIWVFA